jgi:uncharacterized membrane protein YqgA involved in biofilm formation
VRGIGTVVNVALVLAGSVVGLAVGARLPERMRTTVLQAIGLVVLGLGVQEFVGTRNAMFPLASVVVGGLVGEALRLEDRLEALGEMLRRRVEKAGADHATFTEGFVTASLTFCVGPLTVVGSLQDGLGAGAQLLLVKSCLDGAVAVVYAATLGVGVAASVVTVAVVQGAITVLGVAAGHHLLDARMVTELTAAGGVMITGLGLRILEIKPMRVASLLPGLVIAPAAVAVFAR